jgi:hypothetical protein
MVTRRRAGLVLAVLVLAAVVTGCATSAAKTVTSAAKILTPEQQLARNWFGQDGMVSIYVNRQGTVTIHELATGHAKFSHITAHRLTISGMCPAKTGTYSYKFVNQHLEGKRRPFHDLVITEIHDPCASEGRMFATTWLGRSP